MHNEVLHRIRERPELAESAAEWFHRKWGVPKEAYLECIEAYLSSALTGSWRRTDDGSVHSGCIRWSRNSIIWRRWKRILHLDSKGMHRSF